MSKDRCWEGYEPTPGKKAYEKGSCRPVKKREFTNTNSHGQWYLGQSDDKLEAEEVNVGGGDTNNRRTYLEAFSKLGQWSIKE